MASYGRSSAVDVRRGKRESLTINVKRVRVCAFLGINFAKGRFYFVVCGEQQVENVGGFSNFRW